MQCRIKLNYTRHPGVFKMLLKKQLPGDSLRCAHERYRPAHKVLKHQGRDHSVVAHQLYFGKAVEGSITRSGLLTFGMGAGAGFGALG